MEATEAFENIIHHIKYSNLNFKLEQSPYSAFISLKKTLLKDRSGNILKSKASGESCASFQQLRSENQALLHKNVELEKAFHSLKRDYENVVDDSENVYRKKKELENKLDDLRVKKEDSEFTELKRRYDILALQSKAFEDNLIEQDSQLEETKAEHGKVKVALKSVITKHEKTCEEFKHLKHENEILEKGKASQSVQLKTVRKEIKELANEHSKEINKLEDKMKDLLEFKEEKGREAKKLKQMKKKQIKREKKEIKKAAEIQIKKSKEDLVTLADENDNKTLEINLDFIEDQVDVPTLEIRHHNILCNHIPQCVQRSPFPPPIGPQTFKQYETELEVTKNEAESDAVESFKKKILDFMKSEPGDTINTSIEKLEALKTILEPEEDPDKPSELDELIELAQSYSKAIEEMSVNKDDDDDDNFYYEDDNLPPHYWGGEDCCELIFYDDEI